MQTSSSEHPITGSFFYEVTTPEQRAGAATHMQQLLQNQLALLTHKDWLDILDEFKPTLRVRADGVVIVAQGFLSLLTSWATFYHASRYEFPEENAQDPEQLGQDVYYLACQLQAYAQRAKVLLAADPDLVRPISIDQLRDIIHRLAVGNTVAERCAETRPPRIIASK